MGRYRLLIEYDGTRYAGWQYQQGVKTIQGEFYKAITEAFKTDKFELYGSGRTDAGVHAIEQAAHLDIKTNLPLIKIKHAINDLLPHDINVLQIDEAPANFHARHDAYARSYIYLISKRRSAFSKPYVWWVKDKLSPEIMQQCANLFYGMHDFKSFSDDSPEEKSTKVDIQFVEVHEYGDMYIVHIVGSHFLHKMVRRLVGVMVECGRNKLKVKDVEKFLDTHSREPARYTAPPSGLYLEKVYYQGEEILQGENAYKLPFCVI